MHFHFLVRGESPLKQLSFGLLALLNQVTAAVNDLGLDQSFLVELARTLHYLDQGVDQLHAQVARVAIYVLFFVDCEHLRHIRHEIEGLLVGCSVAKSLLSQVILKLSMVALSQQLNEPKQAHRPNN